MRVQSYLGFHMQDPFPEWNDMLREALDAGYPMRAIKVFHPEDYPVAKEASPDTRVVYRPYVDKLNQGHWVDMARNGQAWDAAHDYIDQWADSVLAHMPGGAIESLNEEYPTGDLDKLRAIAAFDLAFVQVMAERLPGRRPVVFTAAVGNPGWDELEVLRPLAAAVAEVGGAFGYHAYWPVKDKVSGVLVESAKRHLHLRWAGIDDYLVSQGIRVNWFLGEIGPIGCDYLDPPPGGNWNLKPLDGWKYSHVLDGDLMAYVDNLHSFDILAARTGAAREGRLWGSAIFTSKPWVDQWKHFNTIGGDAWAVINQLKQGVEQDPVEPPPDDLRSTIWAASIEEQLARGLSLNPAAGLQAAIFADDMVPVHSEIPVEFNGRVYMAQASEDLTGKRSRRVYVYEPGKPIWFFEKGQQEIEIIDVVDELPKHDIYRYQTRSLDVIDRIVIHHTVSVTTPENFARYHVNSRGWPGIGYHFLVYSDGRIYQTNYLTSISYHAGNWNKVSVGMALVGNFTDHGPTEAQLQAAQQLIAYLRRQLGKPDLANWAHRDLPGASTQCPGNTYRAWLDRLN